MDELLLPIKSRSWLERAGRSWRGVYNRIPRWVLADIALPLLATRLMLVMVAWLGFHVFPRPVGAEGAWELSKYGRQIPLRGLVNPDVHPVLNMWSRWDSYWYLDIAQHGYQFTPDFPSNAAFYPLYPMAMRAVHGVLGMHGKNDGWIIAGLIVSNVALVVALIYLRLLT